VGQVQYPSACSRNALNHTYYDDIYFSHFWGKTVPPSQDKEVVTRFTATFAKICANPSEALFLHSQFSTFTIGNVQALYDRGAQW
jgi:hypothetical protein